MQLTPTLLMGVRKSKTQLDMIKCLRYHKKETRKLTCTMVLQEFSEASTILYYVF